MVQHFTIPSLLTVLLLWTSASAFAKQDEKREFNDKTPINELLPPRPIRASQPAAPFNDDLNRVPEVIFGEPLSRQLTPQQSTEQMAQRLEKVNFLNGKERDGFLKALIRERTELQGLPFRMGDDCRASDERARMMPFLSSSINQALQESKNFGSSFEGFFDALAEMQARPILTTSKGSKVRVSRENEEHYYRTLISTMMQVVGPEDEKFRVRLARSLSTIPHIDATHALAQLAIFAPEKDVRDAAIAGLKLRRERDYTDILMSAFRYPLPSVSQRAAEALVKLERKDLVANLVDELGQRDPRLPVTKQVDGKDVAVVHELVKVNHHHNCALCHAPAAKDTPNFVLQVPVQLPSEPFPGQGGYEFRSPMETKPGGPNIFVRIDMTYLRQDFSLTMRVPNATPWPDMQRFDFFVRSRVVTPKEAQAWRDAAKERANPYQQSALVALRELTGRDAEANPQAWREMLKLPTRSQ